MKYNINELVNSQEERFDRPEPMGDEDMVEDGMTIIPPVSSEIPSYTGLSTPYGLHQMYPAGLSVPSTTQQIYIPGITPSYGTQQMPIYYNYYPYHSPCMCMQYPITEQTTGMYQQPQDLYRSDNFSLCSLCELNNYKYCDYYPEYECCGEYYN